MRVVGRLRDVDLGAVSHNSDEKNILNIHLHLRVWIVPVVHELYLFDSCDGQTNTSWDFTRSWKPLVCAWIRPEIRIRTYEWADPRCSDPMFD